MQSTCTVSYTHLEIEDGCQTENAFGTYLHGVCDAPEAALRTAQALAKKQGVTLTGEALDTHAYKEQQYDKLADSVRKSLDVYKRQSPQRRGLRGIGRFVRERDSLR